MMSVTTSCGGVVLHGCGGRAIVVFIRKFYLWNFQVLQLGFSPLHADVWSEDSCRQNGTVRLLPAAWRGLKFFLRIVLPRRYGNERSARCFPCLGLRVARVSFLVRVLVLRTRVESCTMVFSSRKRNGKVSS